MSLVNYEKFGAIAEITLNRPEKLNAINGAMLDVIGEKLSMAESDDEVRVVILKGEGRAFSAGFDLDTADTDSSIPHDVNLRRELQHDFNAIMGVLDFPKPIIAAVHGFCLGSSMEVSAVCDITIASETCRFGAPEVRFGSGIVCLILPWIIGQKKSRELLLVGSDRIDSHTALAAGLVNQVVADGQVFTEARRLAGEIALNDPLAVRLTKKALNRSLELAGMRAALEEALEIDIEIELTETPESKAFNDILEKDGPKAALRWRAQQLPDSTKE